MPKLRVFDKILGMEDLKVIVANNLIFLRKKLGLTQLELAEKLNYSDKAISKWERGESLPDVETLKNIANLFSVDLDYLVTEHQEEKKKISLNQFKAHNRLIITMLAFLGVWFVATLIFSICKIVIPDANWLWLIFIVAIPLGFVVLLVFNCIWGYRNLTFVILTLLGWTGLLAIYLCLLQYNIWPIFLVGIPMQLLIIFWSRLKTLKWFTRKNKNIEEK